MGPTSIRPKAFITELLALFTLYFGIASESDVVEASDVMPLVCLFPMATRDKLMCRRRLGSLLTNPFICFGGCWTLCRKNVKINNDGGSGKALTINHREYKSSTRQIGERFLTTFAKLKVVSPTAMAKLATYSAILETLVINREIFIQNREIVITTSKIGTSPAKSGDLEALYDSF